MGTSSRSSSTLKNPFQTFKSFYTIQPTSRTIRMKFILMLSFVVLAASQVVTSDDPNDDTLWDDIMWDTSGVQSVQKQKNCYRKSMPLEKSMPSQMKKK